jgi:hypothetical protein
MTERTERLPEKSSYQQSSIKPGRLTLTLFVMGLLIEYL